MKKIREYKGVTYDPEHVEAGHKVGTFRYGQETFWSAAHVVTAGICTDDDHAALMDLKANPYKPMTAADHIAALVAMGAERGLASQMYYDADVLYLPPEMTT